MAQFNQTYPLTNGTFLKVLSDSFNEFVASRTSRSTKKLKPLHGAVAKDISNMLGDEYMVMAQGFANDKEGTIAGRYIDKRVDITISCAGSVVAGIAVKFVMQNYSQNSNNYFENMLGETANIRCNGIPYFQIFIIADKLPYYKKDNTISRWESFSVHNIDKYIKLSLDNTDLYMHTPNKTLIYVIHISDECDMVSKDDYFNYYESNLPEITISQHTFGEFGSAVILNDYELFREKLYHTVKSL